MHITVEEAVTIREFFVVLGYGFAFGLGWSLATWLFNALRLRGKS